MNTPHTYGGNVVQLGRTIAKLRDGYHPPAPMIVDALEEDYGPTIAPRTLTSEHGGWLNGYLMGLLTGAGLSALIAVARVL